MPLDFSGRTTIDVHGDHAVDAKDATTGQHVAVRVTAEAMQDHDVGLACRIAEQKYDKGQLASTGGIVVTTDDF